MKYFVLFFLILLTLPSITFLKVRSVPVTKEKHNIENQLSCPQIYNILKKKKKLKKNKIIFCDGQLVSSMLTKKSYDAVPQVFHRLIKRINRMYVFHIAHQVRDSKKKRNLMNLYLLSNDKESKAILSAEQKLEFRGQIIQQPIFLDESWHFLLLREETAIRIE